MLDQLQEATKKLLAKHGVIIEFDADAALKGYKRGKRLPYKVLVQLPDNAVVWVQCKEYGDEGLRADGPYRIEKLPTGEWMLEDGSSFALDFEHTEATDAACECEYEEGWIRLYYAKKC